MLRPRKRLLTGSLKSRNAASLDRRVVAQLLHGLWPEQISVYLGLTCGIIVRSFPWAHTAERVGVFTAKLDVFSSVPRGSPFHRPRRHAFRWIRRGSHQWSTENPRSFHESPLRTLSGCIYIDGPRYCSVYFDNALRQDKLCTSLHRYS